MGVKTAITLEELCTVFPCTTLVPSENGVSDTVYFTDQGVIKLFETASLEAVVQEYHLLLNLSHLPVNRPKKPVFSFHGKPCIVYETLRGSSLHTVTGNHIIQISEFLHRFHQSTQGTHSSNPKLFERPRLKSLIDQTGHGPLQDIFDSIDLELSCDGVIHGDLFLDNVLFEGGELSGVLDFGEACEGDFLFDLAVVAISWCLDGANERSNIETLLAYYNSNLCIHDFLPYMKYALLYYATTRYLNGRDYQELLNKIPLLDKLKGTL